MIRKIEFPRIVMVGRDCLDEIGSATKEVALGKNALVVAGKKTMDIAGNRVAKNLEKAGFKVTTYMSEQATEKSVSEVQAEIRKNKVNIVLAVGGGNAIDTAKLSSAREKIAFISVPTAASHDGMGSPIASIRVDGGLKSFSANAPIAIIADISVIKKAPPRLLASGCGDLVSNYTAVEDWKLAHKLRGEYYGDYAAALSIMSAKTMLDSIEVLKTKSEKAVHIVMEGLISSGAAMSITGSSRPCSGAEHMFSHALDKVSPAHAMHGEQCGVGTIMMAYLHGLEWRRFRDTLKAAGAPTNAEELGIEPEYIIKALTMAHKIRDRYTILGSNGLTEQAATDLAEKTGVV